jgi:hypothetical protein
MPEEAKLDRLVQRELESMGLENTNISTGRRVRGGRLPVLQKVPVRPTTLAADAGRCDTGPSKPICTVSATWGTKSAMRSQAALRLAKERPSTGSARSHAAR